MCYFTKILISFAKLSLCSEKNRTVLITQLKTALGPTMQFAIRTRLARHEANLAPLRFVYGWLTDVPRHRLAVGPVCWICVS